MKRPRIAGPLLLLSGVKEGTSDSQLPARVVADTLRLVRGFDQAVNCGRPRALLSGW